MSNDTATTQRQVTPRRVAWVLVLLGAAWFVQASPKTPLEFFDAAARDRDAMDRRTMEKYMTIDPAAAAGARQYNELILCGRRMNRIALIHDITSDPARVRMEKYSIVSGTYMPDKPTEDYLRANDGQYQALAKELADRRTAIKANKELASKFNRLQSSANSDKLYQLSVFRMEIDRLMIRQFQARIFWWEVR